MRPFLMEEELWEEEEFEEFEEWEEEEEEW